MKKRIAKKIFQNQGWIILLALSLLVTLLRLPSLEQPFDNDSGANAYHARLIVDGEPLYGTHHPAHHMPAVYYVYALGFLLLGDSTWAVKFLLIPWTIVTAYLLYRLGVSVMDRATGLLAALFYVILSSHVLLYGTTAEIELFANLPRIAAFLVLMHLTTRQAAAWKFVFVGLLSAMAFLFKAVYLSPLALAGWVLLAELWRTRTAPGAWRRAMRRGLWVGLGFVAALLLVVAYFALVGLLPRFLLVFTLGQEYVNFRQDIPSVQQYWPFYPLLGLAVNNVALLILSLAGFVAVGMSRLRDTFSQKAKAIPCVCPPGQSPDLPPPQGQGAFYVAIWYLFSFFEAGITRVLFFHYYLLIVPPLALLAAWFLLRIYRDLQVHTARRSVATWLLATVLAVTFFFSARQNFNYYSLYTRYKLGEGTYRDFLLDGWPDHKGIESVRVEELVDYIQRHTVPSDRIYYWSGGVQLYYLADRRCPIDVIWPVYAKATGPYERIFVPQTKYVIVGESNNVPRPDWLYAELAKAYELETVIRDQEIYRRAD